MEENNDFGQSLIMSVLEFKGHGMNILPSVIFILALTLLTDKRSNLRTEHYVRPYVKTALRETTDSTKQACLGG
jgi:hypothetical protein